MVSIPQLSVRRAARSARRLTSSPKVTGASRDDISRPCESGKRVAAYRRGEVRLSAKEGGREGIREFQETQYFSVDLG